MKIYVNPRRDNTYVVRRLTKYLIIYFQKSTCSPILVEIDLIREISHFGCS